MLMPMPVLVVALTMGARAPGVSAPCVQPTTVPPAESGEPRNIDGLKDQLTYYQCSGAYDREVNRVLDSAIAYVVRRSVTGTKLALVLDIDETSLSNWQEIKANDFGFIPRGGLCDHLPDGPCPDSAWERQAAAGAINPTLRLFTVAQAHHVAVFFISGRRENLREGTTTNLHNVGYSDWVDLLLRPVDDTLTVQQFKTAQRKQITMSGYRIIANVGDQYSDLRGGYAERRFKVPNPFYFIP